MLTALFTLLSQLAVDSNMTATKQVADTNNPVWNYEHLVRNVAASSELVVEVWCIEGESCFFACNFIDSALSFSGLFRRLSV